MLAIKLRSTASGKGDTVLRGSRRPEVVAQCTFDDGHQPQVYRLELDRIPTQTNRYTVEFTLRSQSGEIVQISSDPAWSLVIWCDSVREALHIDPEKQVWRGNLSYRRDEIEQFTYELKHGEDGMLAVR